MAKIRLGRSGESYGVSGAVAPVRLDDSHAHGAMPVFFYPPQQAAFGVWLVVQRNGIFSSETENFRAKLSLSTNIQLSTSVTANRSRNNISSKETECCFRICEARFPSVHRMGWILFANCRYLGMFSQRLLTLPVLMV
ncbi:MAG: hypothetical protein LBP86_10490 [Azoarcus sp.]|jgi:hypothetical protein|nr:hypothetical protein [Azoarcus sp.]